MTTERVIETACGPITARGMEYIKPGAVLIVCGAMLTYIPACKVYSDPCQDTRVDANGGVTVTWCDYLFEDDAGGCP